MNTTKSNNQTISSSKKLFMKIRVQNDLVELEKNPMEHFDRIEREILKVDIGKEVGFITFTEKPKYGFYANRKLFVSIIRTQKASFRTTNPKFI